MICGVCPLIPANSVALPRCDFGQVTDPAEMAADPRLNQRLPGKRDVLSYELMDRRLLRERSQNPIATMSILPLGGENSIVAIGWRKIYPRVDADRGPQIIPPLHLQFGKLFLERDFAKWFPHDLYPRRSPDMPA